MIRRASDLNSLGMLALAGLVLCAAPGAARAADEVVRIGGTGMALAAMTQLGESWTAVDPKMRVEVLPSLGTSGGLRALAEGAIDVAVIGRSLKNEERAKGASEASCLTTPLVFASSHPAPASVAVADVAGIYANPSPNWPDSKPLKILLRSRAGSENDYLVAMVPGMAAALAAAYQRPGIPIAVTDQENAELALRTAGSFAVMTVLQIRAERLNLHLVPLDGVLPSPEAVANGTYPMSVQVCIVVPNALTPSAAKFIAHLRSASGQAMLQALGAMPSK